MNVSLTDLIDDVPDPQVRRILRTLADQLEYHMATHDEYQQQILDAVENLQGAFAAGLDALRVDIENYHAQINNPTPAQQAAYQQTIDDLNALAAEMTDKLDVDKSFPPPPEPEPEPDDTLDGGDGEDE